MFKSQKDYFYKLIAIEVACVTLLSSGVSLLTTWALLKFVF